MTMRSIVLWAHLVGMLALFAGFAIEWICIERLRSPDEPGPPMFTVRVLARLPRVIGIAAALILASGIWLAVRIGLDRAPFVGLSVLGLVLMAVLGGIALRPLLRAVKERGRPGGDSALVLREFASRPFLRSSLWIRVCVALAIVYVMIAKPDLFESAMVLVVSVLVAIVISRARTAAALSPEDVEHPARPRSAQ